MSLSDGWHSCWFASSCCHMSVAVDRCQECDTNLQLLQEVWLQNSCDGSIIPQCRSDHCTGRLWSADDKVALVLVIFLVEQSCRDFNKSYLSWWLNTVFAVLLWSYHHALGCAKCVSKLTVCLLWEVQGGSMVLCIMCDHCCLWSVEMYNYCYYCHYYYLSITAAVFTLFANTYVAHLFIGQAGGFIIVLTSQSCVIF